MGDSRTYERVIALRAVGSVDGMTANWFYMPPGVLEEISTSITNKIKGINRVVYDVSNKPPLLRQLSNGNDIQFQIKNY